MTQAPCESWSLSQGTCPRDSLKQRFNDNGFCLNYDSTIERERKLPPRLPAKTGGRTLTTEQREIAVQRTPCVAAEEHKVTAIRTPTGRTQKGKEPRYRTGRQPDREG